MSSLGLVDALSPLHEMTRIFGLRPYKIIKCDGDYYEFAPSKYGLIYSFCIGATILVLHINFTVLNMESIQMDFSSITHIVDFYYVYCVEIILATLIIMNWYRQDYMIEAFKRLQKVDETLMKMDQCLHYHQVKKWISLVMVLSVLALLVIEYVNCNLFIGYVRNLDQSCYFACSTLLIIIFLETFSFLIYVLLIHQRFRIINDILKSSFPRLQFFHLTKFTINIRPSDFQKSVIIVQTRILHFELCRITKLINGYFGVQLLLSIGFIFVGFTTNAYHSFYVIFHNLMIDRATSIRIPSSLIWIATNLFGLLAISASCYKSKSESFKTGEILFTISDRFDKRFAPKLSLFGKQILHCDLKLTALDLFDLDMTLFYGVVGSAAAYITILIQFEITAEMYSNTTLHITNSTLL